MRRNLRQIVSSNGFSHKLLTAQNTEIGNNNWRVLIFNLFLKVNYKGNLEFESGNHG